MAKFCIDWEQYPCLRRHLIGACLKQACPDVFFVMRFGRKHRKIRVDYPPIFWAIQPRKNNGFSGMLNGRAFPAGAPISQGAAANQGPLPLPSLSLNVQVFS
jgi:hypothetical protein